MWETGGLRLHDRRRSFNPRLCSVFKFQCSHPQIVLSMLSKNICSLKCKVKPPPPPLCELRRFSTCMRLKLQHACLYGPSFFWSHLVCDKSPALLDIDRMFHCKQATGRYVSTASPSVSKQAVARGHEVHLSGTIQRQGRSGLIGRQTWPPSVYREGLQGWAPWLLRRPMFVG